MFTAACESYGQWHCVIIVPIKDEKDPVAVGRGTMLAESLVLTANHVVAPIDERGSLVFVRCRTGLWMAKIMWQYGPYDLALLILVKQIESSGQPAPKR